MGKVYKAKKFDCYDDLVADLKQKRERCDQLKLLAGNNMNATIRFGSMYYLESTKTVVGINAQGNLISLYVNSWAELMNTLETRENDIYGIESLIPMIGTGKMTVNSSNYNDCMIVTEMIDYYHGMIECNNKQDFSDMPIIERDESLDDLMRTFSRCSKPLYSGALKIDMGLATSDCYGGVQIPPMPVAPLAPPVMQHAPVPSVQGPVMSVKQSTPKPQPIVQPASQVISCIDNDKLANALNALKEINYTIPTKALLNV